MTVLVAGVGNVFLGDDGFGVEVARRLLSEPLPPRVEVADFGIRGIHLAYRLLEPVSLLVVADAIRRGNAPGTLYVVAPEVDALEAGAADAHGFDLPAVLGAVRSLGGALPPVRIVGCEPADLGEGMGLSPAVEAAVGPAARLVREVVERAMAGAAASAAAAEGDR